MALFHARNGKGLFRTPIQTHSGRVVEIVGGKSGQIDDVGYIRPDTRHLHGFLEPDQQAFDDIAQRLRALDASPPDPVPIPA